MPDEKKKELRARFQRWKNLSAQERSQLKKKFLRFMNLSPEEKAKLLEKRRQWQALSPEEKRPKRMEIRNNIQQRLQQKRQNSSRD